MEVINYLVQLIRLGMELDQDHVVTYNQMIPIPPDDGLFVAVGLLTPEPYAFSLSYHSGLDSNGNPALIEEQTLNVRSAFSVHIMSRNTDARNRCLDLIFALTNTASVQCQETNGFKVANLPNTFADASEPEGAGMLTRLVATVSVLHVKGRSGAVEFYDKFNGTPTLVTQQ